MAALVAAGLLPLPPGVATWMVARAMAACALAGALLGPTLGALVACVVFLVSGAAVRWLVSDLHWQLLSSRASASDEMVVSYVFCLTATLLAYIVGGLDDPSTLLNIAKTVGHS